MAYNKIYFFLIFIFFAINSCYHPSTYPFIDSKKRIEIGKFSEKIKIPRRSIAFDFKKNMEEYILNKNPYSLAIRNGDVILEGEFLECIIIPIGGSHLKKIQIKAKIYYRDRFDPDQSWEKHFLISEKFYHKKELFLKKSIDRIIEKLTIQVYHEIFKENKN
ncbi:hypothetical protein [Blattabacterium cuenoti]|uniref:hypothetical protein n=1 Tax=Blattabacterium cuenoti TaxID=1653831 RepID=UPI00163C4D22|nr:hypothetical protein [Blattabacterium cuenoti]